MDEDDLINQCWKFYSHDSFPCESDCIAKAHAQGTILSVTVSDKLYGEPLADFYSSVESASAMASSNKTRESKFSRLLANMFVTASFIVFVATFLAFAVARRSRYRESRSAKSRRLLDDDRSPRSKSSRRSKSRAREEEGDGLFRSSGRKSSRSKSKSRKSSSSKQRSRSRSDRRDGDYQPPRGSSRRSSSRARKDDF